MQKRGEPAISEKREKGEETIVHGEGSLQTIAAINNVKNAQTAEGTSGEKKGALVSQGKRKSIRGRRVVGGKLQTALVRSVTES